MMHYSAIKRNKIIIDAIVWINTKNMPNERR